MALEYTITSADAKYFADNNCSLWKGTTNLGATLGQIFENDILEFRANTGFIFSAVPYLELKSFRKYNFVKVTDEKYTLKAPAGASGSGYKGFTVATISNIPVVTVRTFNQADITNFIESNVTASIGGVPVVVGSKLTDQQTLLLTANSGFIINSAIAFDTYGETNPFTVSGDGKTATLQTEWQLTGFSIDTVAEAPFICLTVDQTLLDQFATDKSTGYINDVLMKVGDVVKQNDTIKFVIANDRFTYDGVNINYGSNKIIAMVTATDKLSCSLLWDKKEVINSFAFFTTTLFPVVYTFNAEKYQYFVDRKTTVFANDVELNDSGIIYKGDVIKIVCDSAYEFITGQAVQISSYIMFDMDLTEDRKTATYTYDEDIAIYGFIFTTVKSATVDTDTSNNTYQITPRELRNLEALKLKEFDVNGVEIADYSNLLVGVMRYPFSIPTDLKGSYGGIYLGAKQYDEVKATDIITDIITIDLGTINCVGQYNDLRDYADTEAILRLPHLSSVNLDLEYVIDQTIGVKYVVNLINGETTVIITSSKLPLDNNTLLTLNATLGTPIPIAHKDGFNYQPIDTNNLRLGGINDISSPTIDIVRNEQVNGDSMFTIPVKDSGLLTDFRGWTKIDDIVMTVNATQQEKQDIIGLLKTGVFFNDD